MTDQYSLRSSERRRLARGSKELPETLPSREAPGRLRERILAAARAELTADRAPARDNAWIARLVRPALALAVALWIAVGAAALVGENLRLSNEVRVAATELAKYESIAYGIREGGRWWYMGGKDEWAGSGGTLIAPRVEGVGVNRRVSSASR